MSLSASSEADLARIDRIERHAAACWPARHVASFGEGWLLRATPGLARARSNNTLTPRRILDPGELDAALDAGAGWARRYGTRHGMQVTPLDLHAPVTGHLGELGWEAAAPVIVMGVSVDRVPATEPLALEVVRRATPAWSAAWARCNGYDPDEARAHVDTVFALLAGRGTYVRAGEEAVGIAVDEDGLVGLFSLAVRGDLRRRGVGRRLVAAMLARAAAPEAYLQVSSENEAGLRLYDGLGFQALYSYQHWYSPQVT